MDGELKRKIFRSSEKTHYVKYDYNGLVRTDYKTKMEGLQKAIDAGFMCPDEARHVVGLSPIPDGLGKIFRFPMNYVAAQNFLDYLPNKKDNGTN
jgi:phage portal protein BeeE